MYEDVLKGKWKEIKGGIKEKWGKLTDDDLTEIEGKKDKLLGFLQKRYGYAKDKAEQEYNDFIDRYNTCMTCGMPIKNGLCSGCGNPTEKCTCKGKYK
jgi:uncharacterized protein YjbJ (UPF0337 family)